MWVCTGDAKPACLFLALTWFEHAGWYPKRHRRGFYTLMDGCLPGTSCREDDINLAQIVAGRGSWGAEVSGRETSQCRRRRSWSAEEFNVVVINCQSLGSASSALSQLDTLIILTGCVLSALSPGWRPDNWVETTIHKI